MRYRNNQMFSVFALVLFLSCSAVSCTYDSRTDRTLLSFIQQEQADMVILEFPDDEYAYEYCAGWFDCFDKYVAWNRCLSQGETPSDLNSSGLYSVHSKNFPAPTGIAGGSSAEIMAMEFEGYSDCRASLIRLTKLYGDELYGRLAVQGLTDEDIVVAGITSMFEPEFLEALQARQ